jgi:hypothetical protein
MALVAKKYRALALCAMIILIGLITGATVVIVPPMAAFGLVGLAGVFLIWAIPELRGVPESSLRKAFFVMVVIQLSVPAYYTIQVPGLPWISIRRIVAFIAISLCLLAIAGSKSARERVVLLLAESKALAVCAIGFLVMIFMSIITSVNIPASLSQTADVILNWYIPLFACMLVMRSQDDITFLIKLICICSIAVGILGISEFITHHRYLFDVFPKSMLAKMMEDNPSIAVMVNANPYRNGIYRASSIFTVPLSFGEFEAMVAPIAVYFILHGRSTRDRTFGAAVTMLSIVSIFCSGARGGAVAFLISIPALLILWLGRYSRANPLSLVSAIGTVMSILGIATTLALVLLWGRLHNIVLGGGDTAASNDARFIQWDLATPHILENPITGHGIGLGADVIGFYTPSGVPSVDSYVLSLLVETGVPGLIFFVGMIGYGLWVNAKLYLTDLSDLASFGGPLASSILAFSVYRLGLSLRESHTLFFLVIGLTFIILHFARKSDVIAQRTSLRGCGSSQSGVLLPTNGTSVGEQDPVLPSRRLGI